VGCMLLWLRGRIPTRRKKSSRFEGCECGSYAIGWGLHKNHQHRLSLLPHSGPDWGLFLAAPYMPNSESCLSWMKAKNYQQENWSCRDDEPPQPPKQPIAPRKQICDIQKRKCFDWAPEAKYWQVWRYYQCDNNKTAPAMIMERHLETYHLIRRRQCCLQFWPQG
jgi:hypothetical protein